jgi:hypothetical protein
MERIHLLFLHFVVAVVVMVMLVQVILAMMVVLVVGEVEIRQHRQQHHMGSVHKLVLELVV